MFAFLSIKAWILYQLLRARCVYTCHVQATQPSFPSAEVKMHFPGSRIVRLEEQIINKLWTLDRLSSSMHPSSSHLSRSFSNAPSPATSMKPMAARHAPSIQVTRAVSWFVTLRPVVAQIGLSDSLATTVRIARQAR